MTMTTKRIDMTPDWQATLPLLLALVESGGPEGRAVAVEELRRMAKLADIGVETLTLQQNAQRTIPALGAEFVV